MDTKQRKYRDLIERVKKSYPARNWRKVIPYLHKESTAMFQDKVIVITGGANGIGKCIAV